MIRLDKERCRFTPSASRTIALLKTRLHNVSRDDQTLILTMRRSQSVRNQHRPAVMVGSDDLSVVEEDEQSLKDVLRTQLLEKDKENDKVGLPQSRGRDNTDTIVQLRMHIAQLKSQLAERPSVEAVDALKKEYMNLELLLDGTQRENERCMAELEKCALTSCTPNTAYSHRKCSVENSAKKLSKVNSRSWQVQTGRCVQLFYTYT